MWNDSAQSSPRHRISVRIRNDTKGDDSSSFQTDKVRRRAVTVGVCCHPSSIPPHRIITRHRLVSRFESTCHTGRLRPIHQSRAQHLGLRARALQRLLWNNIVEQKILTQNCPQLKGDLMKTKLSPSIGCLQDGESVFSSISASSHGLASARGRKEERNLPFVSPCFN